MYNHKVLTLRLLDPATDLALYREAYNWRSQPKPHIQPDRMSFDTFASNNPRHLTIGLFNGEMQALYFLREVEPGVFEAHFTSKPVVSVVHYCNESLSEGNAEENLQLAGLRESDSQPKNPAILPASPCRTHAELAQGPSLDAGTTTKGHIPQYCQCLPEAGQVDSAAVRDVWNQQESGEAPRGLQQATGNTMAMSSLPPRRTCNCRRVALQTFHESLLTGAAEVARQILANGGTEIHAWVTPRNRPLRSFLESLGFTQVCQESFPCAPVSNGATLPNEPRNLRQFVKYALKG